MKIQRGLITLSSGVLSEEIILDESVPVGNSFVVSSLRLEPYFWTQPLTYIDSEDNYTMTTRPNIPVAQADQPLLRFETEAGNSYAVLFCDEHLSVSKTGDVLPTVKIPVTKQSGKLIVFNPYFPPGNIVARPTIPDMATNRTVYTLGARDFVVFGDKVELDVEGTDSWGVSVTDGGNKKYQLAVDTEDKCRRLVLVEPGGPGTRYVNGRLQVYVPPPPLVPPGEKTSGGLSAGVIVIIVAAVLVMLALLGLGFYLWSKKGIGNREAGVELQHIR